MWHSSYQAISHTQVSRGRWRFVVLLALLSFGIYGITSPSWHLVVERATGHLPKSVAALSTPSLPSKRDVVVIVTGEEIQHGFGDFVKHIAAAVVIAEIMGAELLSVNGNSYHGYDSARLMDVKMSGRGPVQISGRVCEATELLSSGVRDNLYKTCVAGGEVHVAAVKKALDGCGVVSKKIRSLRNATSSSDVSPTIPVMLTFVRLLQCQLDNIQRTNLGQSFASL